MPEANRIEVVELSNARTKGRSCDSDGLVREIYSTRTKRLNRLYKRGRVLFAEGEQARGVYILTSGSASVSFSSNKGRVLILRVARSGDVLGCSSVLRNSTHNMTVTTLEPSCADFISRREFIDLLDRSKSANRAVLSIVSKELADLCEHTKSLLLAQTASAKLAKLLLEWCLESEHVELEFVRIDKPFTHEQIAQMIGASRETVTRLFAGLRMSQIIRMIPSGILVQDRIALESIAHGSTNKLLLANANVGCC